MREQRIFLYIGLGCLLFNIYGSLLPFELHPQSVDEVIRKLLNIRYLDLGMYQRADWVANLLLYVPPAFFLGGWAGGLRRGTVSGWLAPLVICTLVFVGIEIAQIVFPQRTVSLNDLIAEFMGTLLGIVAWQLGGPHFVRMWRSIAAGGHPAIRAALLAYAILYLLLAFFPFDFVMSGAELTEKLQGESVNLFVMGGFSPLLRLVSLFTEMAVAAPFGVLLALELSPVTRRQWSMVALGGLVLGVMTELVQMFLVSGIVQGVSVVTRLFGVMAGAIALVVMQHASWTLPVRFLKLGVMFCVPPYAYVLLKLNHWFENGLLPLEKALTKLDKLSFIPFYYHYFTTEVMAMQSLLMVTASYSPVGIGVWLYQGMPWKSRHRSGLMLAVLVSSAVVEFGKLFFEGARPDTTNCLIAALGAGVFYSLCCWVRRWLLQAGEQAQAADAAPAPSANPVRNSPSLLLPRTPSSLLSVLAGLATVFCGGWYLAQFPVVASFLVVGLALYVAVLWCFPHIWLAAIVAAIPLLDLTPWSGRVFFNEFDIVVMITLMIAYLRGGKSAGSFPGLSLPAGILVGVFCLMEAVALYRGLLPLSGEAFSHYFSHWNALRIEKGVVWAILSLGLLYRHDRGGGTGLRQLTWGMVAGLAITVVAVNIERHIYTGLWDYDSDYRPAGLFSAMHTGDAYLDAYLILALPFTLLALQYCRLTWAKLLCISLLLSGIYTLLLTYTRSDYLALAASAVVMVLFYLMRAASPSSKGRVILSVVFLAMAIAGLVSVVWSGSFIKARFATVESGGSDRYRHWQETVSMLDSGIENQLFGRGLGSFPRDYFLSGQEAQGLASYQILEDQDKNRFLRLGGGSRVYVGQRLNSTVSDVLTISVAARHADTTAGEPGLLTFILCEKAIQHSFNCTSRTLSLVISPEWQRLTAEIAPGTFLGQGGRPVELAVINTRSGTLVDVDDIELFGREGPPLLANGNFEQGADHWFMSSDSHFAWHPFNAGVYVLFERGLLGVIAWLLLLAAVCYRLLAGNRSGAPAAPVIAGALAGVVMLGLFNTLIDEPKTLFLFLLLAGWVLANHPGAKRALAKNQGQAL